MNIEVFHGTNLESARRFHQGDDLFFAQRPDLPVAIFSTFEGDAIASSYEFGNPYLAVTHWSIPEEYLTNVDSEESDHSQWYYPNLVVIDLTVLPEAFLKSTKFKTARMAKLAVERGNVIFVHAPHEFYRGYERTEDVLRRFLENQDKR